MKKLRICLVSLTVSPDSTDGEAKVIRSIFEYLKKQGHDVTLIAGKWNEDLEDPDIIQVNLIRKRFLWLPLFNFKVIKYLRKSKFDVIHANSPKAALPVILSGKKRFITVLHDFIPFETKLTSIPIEKNLIKYTAKKSTFIITVSNMVKKQFNKYLPKINQEKIYTIYNGIEDIFRPFPKEAKHLKEKLNIKGPVLLYIGRITQYKGVDHLIEAYKIMQKNIPDLNLIIGGKPDYLMEKQYEQWKSRNPDIHFLGFIPDAIVPHYYSMADAFVSYSSSSEGFGLTLLESISCGTPVVCSSIPVFQEILQENAIFVPPNNPKILAREIENLLKNETKRKQLVEKAMKFIQKYSWDSVGKRLEKVYEKFLKST